MRQLKITLLSLLLLVSGLAKADEGMWLPFLLGRNYEDMKKHGLRLTQEQIYSLNEGSLKDAVISFGGFCTGEIISNKGLILTNHHCGYGAIAGASTEEHNYLDNGFWAKSHQEEIAIPNLSATFVVRIEDVTASIAKELKGLNSEDREAKIRELSAVLTEDATKGTGYKAFVRDFYEGNEFYLFVTETFNDIRLVGTPPQNAGKFGGDTDNWEWPRHTADFSMFRIYAGADNKPAAYNEANKPFTPRHHLPISLKGVKENDYAMIMGFPGSTDRYLSSWGVEQAITLEQPKRVDIRGKKLEIMKSYMDKDVALRLKYSSKYASVANYWKYFIGQTEQVKNNKVIDKKKALEAQFGKFAAGNAEYAKVLNLISSAYETKKEFVYIDAYQSEFLYQVDLMVAAFRFKFMMDAIKEENTPRAEMIGKRLVEMTGSFFEDKNLNLELETVEALLAMYIKDVPAAQQDEFIKKIAAKGDKGIAAFMALVRKKSIFTDKARFDKWKEKMDQKTLTADPMYKLAMAINDAYTKVQETPALMEAEENLTQGRRLFVAGLREMNKDKQFYPNANSTMRLTYGNVLPYSPKDATHYDFVTTFKGVLEKEDPSTPEFNVDAKMKATYLAGNIGQYADENGELVVNFLSNNDITGGNSGSPVINADGHLIGTAFDGNWEAMSGDIFFEPNIQRTINLDIRYTLWIVDKCFGATNLINEMTLIK